MKTVTFKSVMGRKVPCHPWPQSFYVSRFMWETDAYELRPLTVCGLIRGVSMNFVTMNAWRFMHLLRKAGFLDTPELEVLSFRHWRWDFWRVRRHDKRMAAIESEIERRVKKISDWDSR